jgi:hypothetical protein
MSSSSSKRGSSSSSPSPSNPNPSSTKQQQHPNKRPNTTPSSFLINNTNSSSSLIDSSHLIQILNILLKSTNDSSTAHRVLDLQQQPNQHLLPTILGPYLTSIIKNSTTDDDPIPIPIPPPPTILTIRSRLHSLHQITSALHNNNITLSPILPSGRQDEDEIIIIQIPPSIFIPRDRIGYQYEFKKALYTLYLYNTIVKALSNTTTTTTIPLPQIVPPPNHDETSLRELAIIFDNNTKIYIQVCLPMTIPFTMKNIKPNTPYGIRILSSMRIIPHMEELISTSNTFPSFPSACAFLTKWLNRDGNEIEEPTRLMAHSFHLILAHLLNSSNNRILQSADTILLCKRALHWIETCYSSSSITIMDSSNKLNLTWNITLSSLKYLAYRATQYLSSSNTFSIWHDFDKFILVPAPPLFQNNTTYYDLIQQFDSLLGRALSNRVEMYRISYIPSTHHFLVCLSINTTTAYKLVERGPPPEDTVASQSFRELWGKRSELRQFKDGSIIESVIFEESHRKRIPELIVEYIAREHEPFKQAFTTANSIQLISSYLDQFDTDTGDIDRILIKEFHDLQTILTSQLSKDNVPLSVLGVRGICSCLRFTASNPPCPHPMLIQSISERSRRLQNNNSSSSFEKVNKCVHVCNLVLEFESSTKWPDQGTVARIQAKRALLMAIGKSIGTKNYTSFIDGETLIITTSNGFGFRIQVIIDHFEQDAIQLEKHARIHANLHSLSSKFYSFPMVARLAKKWVSGHLLSNVLDDVLVDLIVASLYVNSGNNSSSVPKGMLSGFLRFLDVLARWNWQKQPLLVDVNEYLSLASSSSSSLMVGSLSLQWNNCLKQSEILWKQEQDSGQGLALSVGVVEDIMTTATNTSTIFYGFKSHSALTRMIDLAKKSHLLLENLCRSAATTTTTNNNQPLWNALFSSNLNKKPSFFHVLLYVDDSSLVIQHESKFRNLVLATSQEMNVQNALLGFNPILEYIKSVKEHGLDRFCELYYGNNQLIIGILWKNEGLFDLDTFKVVTSSCCDLIMEDNQVKKLKIDYKQVLEQLVSIGQGFIVKVEELV